MTTARFLAGLHPGFGTAGVWLSQPGVDVTVPGPAANFILRPDLKFEQVILSGAVGMGPGQSAVVPYPATLTQRPYVWLHGNQTGNVEYPSALDAVGGTGSNPNEITFFATIWFDRLEFYNPNGSANLYGFFMVFNRSIGA